MTAGGWKKAVFGIGNKLRGVHGADETIRPEQLADRLEAGERPKLLDTRSEREFHRSRVPGAVLIPHKELPDRLDEVPAAKDEELIVYCEAGVRAAVAEEFLREQGWTKLVHLHGDMATWRALRLPVEEG